ncbi:hypothetical protein AVEN_131282-1, partial [Araneus ventricosus]
TLCPPGSVSGETKDDGEMFPKVYYLCRLLGVKYLEPAAEGLLNLLWFYITSFVTGHSL